MPLYGIPPTDRWANRKGQSDPGGHDQELWGGRQDDWDEFLAAAEFAVNNSYQASIGSTPFRVCHGRDPNVPVTLALNKEGRTTVPIRKGNSAVPRAAEFADRMVQGLQEAKKCLEAARQRQKAYADRDRRAAEFSVGDRVLLSTRNINLRRPSDGTKKLMPKWLGPFTVTKVVNPVAYKLALPATMSRIHDVFHVSLLKPYRDDGRTPPPPPTIEWEGEALCLVDRILDHRFKKQGKAQGDREYLVRWLGYGPEHDTWEPEKNLEMSEKGETLQRYWAFIGFEPPPS